MNQTAQPTATESASMMSIDMIDGLLSDLTKLLDQEKADHGRHTWEDVGSLNHIAMKLREVQSFWTNAEV